MTDKAKESDVVDVVEEGTIDLPSEFVHVRLDGKTKELILAELDLSMNSTDEAIMAVLAKNMRVDIEKFSLFVVDRQSEEGIYLRPDAKFSER